MFLILAVLLLAWIMNGPVGVWADWQIYWVGHFEIDWGGCRRSRGSERPVSSLLNRPEGLRLHVIADTPALFQAVCVFMTHTSIVSSVDRVERILSGDAPDAEQIRIPSPCVSESDSSVSGSAAM